MAGTSWVRLDANYFTNSKARAAGLDGRALHLASICWAATHRTDGRVPASVLPWLCQLAEVRRGAIERVEGAGLWIPNGDGFAIHDYDNHNLTRADWERMREQGRERQRRWRERNVSNGNITP